MARVTKLSSMLDNSSIPNIEDVSRLNSISAVNDSKFLLTPDSTGAMNNHRISERRQYLGSKSSCSFRALFISISILDIGVRAKL